MYGRTDKDYERQDKERVWNRQAERKCIEEPAKTMRRKPKEEYGIER